MQFKTLEQRRTLGAEVVALAIEKLSRSMVTDRDMHDAGLHLCFNESLIIDTTGLCLNRQRSMFLKSPDAHEYRKQLFDTVKAKKMLTKKKQQTAGLHAAAKIAIEAGEFRALDGLPPSTVMLCTRGSCKEHSMLVGWKGCPVNECNDWHCRATIACKKDLEHHVAKHLSAFA